MPIALIPEDDGSVHEPGTGSPAYAIVDQSAVAGRVEEGDVTGDKCVVLKHPSLSGEVGSAGTATHVRGPLSANGPTDSPQTSAKLSRISCGDVCCSGALDAAGGQQSRPVSRILTEVMAGSAESSGETDADRGRLRRIGSWVSCTFWPAVDSSSPMVSTESSPRPDAVATDSAAAPACDTDAGVPARRASLPDIRRQTVAAARFASAAGSLCRDGRLLPTLSTSDTAVQDDHKAPTSADNSSVNGSRQLPIVGTSAVCNNTNVTSDSSSDPLSAFTDSSIEANTADSIAVSSVNAPNTQIDDVSCFSSLSGFIADSSDTALVNASSAITYDGLVSSSTSFRAVDISEVSSVSVAKSNKPSSTSIGIDAIEDTLPPLIQDNSTLSCTSAPGDAAKGTSSIAPLDIVPSCTGNISDSCAEIRSSFLYSLKVSSNSSLTNGVSTESPDVTAPEMEIGDGLTVSSSITNVAAADASSSLVSGNASSSTSMQLNGETTSVVVDSDAADAASGCISSADRVTSEVQSARRAALSDEKAVSNTLNDSSALTTSASTVQDMYRPSAAAVAKKKIIDLVNVQSLRAIAAKVIREKRVFTVHGSYPSVRLALKRRGWVEKKHLMYQTDVDDEIDVSKWPLDNLQSPLEVASLKGIRNSTVMSRLLRAHPTNLFWTGRRDLINFISLEKDQLVNHFPRAPFTTKLGLCGLAGQLHWYTESPPVDTFVPRAYRLGLSGEREAFVDDFHLTACASLLVWFRQQYQQHGIAGVQDPQSEVPFHVLEVALRQCQRFLASRRHEDIEPVALSERLWSHQWDHFLVHFEKIVHQGRRLGPPTDSLKDTPAMLYARVSGVLSCVERLRPQTSVDGCQNIWIVKPGASCRGRGIVLMRRLDSILAMAGANVTQRQCRYVVQKYMERPMLVHNTKFDIRQWFVVTDWNPLTVWMYKQSYLRFSSQEYSLDNLCESVHLCNNAVQCRYKNGPRHPELPLENMWDSSTFQQYLKGRAVGGVDIWKQVVYPGMKEAIIAICLAAQVDTDSRKQCFELFGVDFMLSPDYKPFLIEVNSSPAMGPTTTVTAWLCAMCLEDVIRVVVDRRADPDADVGEFELILNEPAVVRPRYSGSNLCVQGRALRVSGGRHAPPSQPQPVVATREYRRQRRRRVPSPISVQHIAPALPLPSDASPRRRARNTSGGARSLSLPPSGSPVSVGTLRRSRRGSVSPALPDGPTIASCCVFERLYRNWQRPTRRRQHQVPTIKISRAG